MHRRSLPAFVREIDWAMTAVMAVTAFVLVGICAVSVGLLHDRLIAEFKWSNGAVSAIATVYSLSTLLSGPLAGALIDRFGSRPLMLAGAVLAALGFVALGFCEVLYGFYLVFTVIGLGYGSAFYLASTKIIATQSGRHKNICMGIWMFAGSIGAAFFSFAVNWMMSTHGWRTAAFAAAALIALALPAILAFVPRDSAQASRPAAAVAGVPALTPRALFLTPTFLLMTVASALASFGMSAIYFHTVPIFVSAGFSAASASSILGASWVLSAIGSLSFGALSDRIRTRNVLALSLLLGAAGTFALLLAPNAVMGTVAVYGFVFLWGATANAINQFLPLLLVESFGPAHLGALVGVQGAVMGLVGSCAPLITGMLFDRYASYQVSIVASGLATASAILFIAWMPRPRAGAVG